MAVDHGFALYGAISRLLPEFHEDTESGLKLIRGRYCGNGLLDISPFSELVFRTFACEYARFLRLAGKKLEVLGNTVYLGVPKPRSLAAVDILFAPLVITRNGQEQARFVEEIGRQKAALGIKGDLRILKRKTCSIHGKQVVGYSVLVERLTPEDSFLLQGKGLGGRRKMGAGFFEEWDGHGEPISDDEKR